MRTRLYFLGTGTAVPLNRGMPCIALKHDRNIYLLDVGEGCQSRLFSMGLGVVKVKAVLITHLHGDHFLGLFGMLQSMHMLERKDELTIIAPEKLREILFMMVEESAGGPGFPIRFIEIKPDEIVYEDSTVKSIPFTVDHGVEAYGFKIIVKDKYSIVYTGDTRPVDSVIEYSRHADLLIHESTFDSSMAYEAHKQGHSTSADAALTALKAGVKRLVLTHISARYGDTDLLYYDAYRFFRDVIVAEDYMMLIM